MKTVVTFKNKDESEVNKLLTTSAKIRYLNAKQYTRMQIATLLGKRYQHVRNVLEEDIRLGKNKQQ
jgi:hypothetical protein